MRACAANRFRDAHAREEVERGGDQLGRRDPTALSVTESIARERCASSNSTRRTQGRTCPVGDRTLAVGPEHPLDSLFERAARLDTLRPTVLSRSPWVVQFDEWAPAERVRRMLADAAQGRGTPSTAYSSGRRRGSAPTASSVRNSTSFGCSMVSQRCGEVHPTFLRHLFELRGKLQLARGHADGVNVLRYEVGGFYRVHHDYISRVLEPRAWSNCGPRQLSFMLYLTDVEGGGATRFPMLGLDVTPRAGRALLWANVHAEKPLERDVRTAHEALLVTAGTKWVATTWLHAYQMIQNRRSGCCR